MSQTVIVWILVILALVAANLPFVSERLMLVLRLPDAGKSLAWRLAELVLWYFIVGGVGLAFEQSIGQIYPQGWEFYAVTAALFLTLAFPGFVWRYLARRA
ncbi:DUF2818 family protein [Ottowia sp.]|uniref:DUF2818 family protein n=1 Tax=Ottowia sp. TaxID=1898956 RepID=UPI003A884BF1